MAGDIDDGRSSSTTDEGGRSPSSPEYLTATSGLPEVREVDLAAPLRWLRLGWSDLRRAKGASLFYGVALAVMGFVLVRGAGSGAVGLALITGFLIVGPFMLMGLYDISRRFERSDTVDLPRSFAAWRANIPAIGFVALLLALLLAVWIRISVVVVALFFPSGAPEPGQLWAELIASPDGIAFIGAYAAAGLGFALFVFATSVVSLPMLLDRPKMDALSAMITSFNALRASFAPMLLWAVLVVTLTGVGFAVYCFGLIVILPWIGHATWHAYRDTVAAP